MRGSRVRVRVVLWPAVCRPGTGAKRGAVNGREENECGCRGGCGVAGPAAGGTSERDGRANETRIRERCRCDTIWGKRGEQRLVLVHRPTAAAADAGSAANSAPGGQRPGGVGGPRSLCRAAWRASQPVLCLAALPPNHQRVHLIACPDAALPPQAHPYRWALEVPEAGIPGGSGPLPGQGVGSRSLKQEPV